MPQNTGSDHNWRLSCELLSFSASWTLWRVPSGGVHSSDQGPRLVTETGNGQHVHLNRWKAFENCIRRVIVLEAAKKLTFIQGKENKRRASDLIKKGVLDPIMHA